MGAVNFDPTPWLDAEPMPDPAKAAKVAKVEPVEPATLAELAALADPALGQPASDLSAAIRDGLSRLERERAPDMVRSWLWSQFVTDARRLADDGIASRLIDGGWHPLRVFGGPCLPGGDASLEGLAVWLRGRDVRLVLDRGEWVAVAHDGEQVERFTGGYQGDARHDGEVSFLWDLADVQRKRKGK